MDYKKQLREIIKRANGKTTIEREEYIKIFLELTGSNMAGFYSFNLAVNALGFVSKKKENNKIFFLFKNHLITG